jgi:hypothetical protein
MLVATIIRRLPRAIARRGLAAETPLSITRAPYAHIRRGDYGEVRIKLHKKQKTHHKQTNKQTNPAS